VYQLRDEKGEYFALKVFRKKYRDPHLIKSAEVLSHVENFKGLHAARRRIVLPSDPAARKYQNLEYAMLMSWIHGKAWFDVLWQAQQERYWLDPYTAIHLCDCFLEIIEGLEIAGIAHTDISPGNVVVKFNTNDVQLVDLENLYMPGTPSPPQPNLGSAGYRHRSGDKGETTWRPEGDRYGAAVLAAEMLIIANPVLGRKATDEGFFTDHCETSQGMNRYKEAQVWLKAIVPEFALVFERSWFADSLEECPRISELREPINELVNNSAPIPPPSPDRIRWMALH